jgi:hypothetical protein
MSNTQIEVEATYLASELFDLCAAGKYLLRVKIILIILVTIQIIIIC